MDFMTILIAFNAAELALVLCTLLLVLHDKKS